MKRKTRGACLIAMLTSMIASMALATSASASPAWYFDGVELVGSESIANRTPASEFSFLGLIVRCEALPLEMTIWNTSKTGKGEVTELPVSDCITSNPACTIEAFTSEQLPWASNLTTVSSKNYLVIKGIQIGILFGGQTCALYEVLAEVEGTAGGWFDNGTEAVKFSASNSKATGTELTAFGKPVVWTGTFTMRATGPHSDQALTVP